LAVIRLARLLKLIMERAFGHAKIGAELPPKKHVIGYPANAGRNVSSAGGQELRAVTGDAWIPLDRSEVGRQVTRNKRELTGMSGPGTTETYV
jgi:hypothetical protein